MLATRTIEGFDGRIIEGIIHRNAIALDYTKLYS